MKTNWNIVVEDPSGDERALPLPPSADIGRNPDALVPLRDPRAPTRAAVLWQAQDRGEQGLSSPFWIRADENAPPIRLGDLEVREASLPPGVPVTIGETRIRIEPKGEALALPKAPPGARPWLTRCESGKETLWTARKAAETPLSVYLAGETGTGKEVLAHLIHAWSPRASGPFVPLHCGALSLSLAESELFGHVKGAFTGANQHRSGALMQAHNGTLFLDEVGDLPLDIQVKLLRFLENGEIRPVGSDRTSRADVRVVCATHLPLERLVEEGRFRRDLYYRIASVTVRIPPLRERPEDIEMLCRQFASELQHTISPRAMLRLQSYPWPGNVRELRHAVERASSLAGPFTPFLDESAFDFLMTPEALSRTPELGIGAALTLEEMERAMVLRALRLSHGNRAQAARLLGIARSTLFAMLKRHQIRGPRFKWQSIA